MQWLFGLMIIIANIYFVEKKFVFIVRTKHIIGNEPQKGKCKGCFGAGRRKAYFLVIASRFVVEEDLTVWMGMWA